MRNNKNNVKIPAKQPKNAVPVKQKQHEVLAWILAGLMIFWTIASVLGVIAFVHSREEKGHFISASAYSGDITYQNEFSLVCIPAGTFFEYSPEREIPEDLFGPEESMLAQTEFLYIMEFIGFGFYKDLWLPIAVTSNPDLLDNFNFSSDFMLVSSNGEGLTVVQDYYFTVYENDVVGRPGYVRLIDNTGYQLFNSDVFYLEEFDFINSVIDNAHDEGYNEGYAAGVKASSEFTFMGLLSAVIDVPIQAFTGLFNFDLLGINLLNFFLAIFTVCCVLAVLRLIF